MICFYCLSLMAAAHKCQSLVSEARLRGEWHLPDDIRTLCLMSGPTGRPVVYTTMERE